MDKTDEDIFRLHIMSERYQVEIGIDDELVFRTDDMPPEAIMPLLDYMQEHRRRVPYAVSARIFMSYWKRGVKLIEAPTGIWIRAIDIVWDTSDNADETPAAELPESSIVFVPGIADVTEDNSSDIADILSDIYGYCVEGFDYQLL